MVSLAICAGLGTRYPQRLAGSHTRGTRRSGKEFLVVVGIPGKPVASIMLLVNTSVVNVLAYLSRVFTSFAAHMASLQWGSKL